MSSSAEKQQHQEFGLQPEAIEDKRKNGTFTSISNEPIPSNFNCC